MDHSTSESDEWLSQMMGLDSMIQIDQANHLGDELTGGVDVVFPLNYSSSSSYAYPSLLDCSSSMEAQHNLICFGSTIVKPKEEMEISNNQEVTLISQLQCPREGSYDHDQLNQMMNKGFKVIQVTNNKRDINGATKSKPYTSHHQDHVLAERRRREKLNGHFIALSALVPGLKKMDKATVLGDATTYLKQLKERVKKLEEEEEKKAKSSSSIALVMSTTTGGGVNYDGDGAGVVDEQLPEIEARCCDDKNKNISIRIHCERRKGVLVKILEEIEKLHLTVVHSSVMPFADSSLYVTVISQMDVDFSMTLKDLVKNLKSALRD